MFAGYVFVRSGMDKRSYIDIVKMRGVVRLLGEAWDRLAPVPDDEIATIRRVVDTDIPVFPYPYLRDGQQVRITDGPLKGVEGVLVQSKPQKGLLVVSVGLLQRSIAVEVQGTDVVPASTTCRSHSPGWGRAALAAQGLVAEYCVEVGIPYAVFGFIDGNRKVLGRLEEVARMASMLGAVQEGLARDMYSPVGH